MLVPRFASTPVCGKSAPDAAPDFFPSGNNPYWLARSVMPYGRQLRGLGLVPDTSVYGDSWAGEDAAVRQAQQADDVAGNGIFDGPGAPPTAHAGTGVFASNFSLPGYLYREEPTEPSEILDTTTGLPVVYQPGPASWYADTRETYRPFDLEMPRLYSQSPVMRPRGVGLGTVPSGSTVGTKVAGWLPWVMAGVAAGVLLGFGRAYVRSRRGY